MPTYLCHGFRWHRKNIRIFAVLHDIDDAAPEWIIAPASRRGIIATMRELFDFIPPPPSPSKHTPTTPERPTSSWKRKSEKSAYASLALLEEYDPEDLKTLSGPYAYIADHVVRIDLSAGIAGEIAAYEARMRESGSMSGGASDEYGRKRGSKGWLERLRGELEKEEEIRWYVVVCGDEERDAGEADESEEDEEDEETEGEDTEDDAALRRPSEGEGHQGRLAPEGLAAPAEPGKNAGGRRGLRRFLSDLSLGTKASSPSGK